MAPTSVSSVPYRLIIEIQFSHRPKNLKLYNQTFYYQVITENNFACNSIGYMNERSACVCVCVCTVFAFVCLKRSPLRCGKSQPRVHRALRQRLVPEVVVNLSVNCDPLLDCRSYHPRGWKCTLRLNYLLFYNQPQLFFLNHSWGFYNRSKSIYTIYEFWLKCNDL